METGIVKVEQAGEATGTALAVPVELVDVAREFLREKNAPRTREAYTHQWDKFRDWCDARGWPALPTTPDVIALFLADRAAAGIKPASLDVALAAVRAAHLAAGLASPCTAQKVKDMRDSIRRKVGTAPAQKAPVTVPELRAMVAAAPAGVAGFRDRALLLLGFAGGFRRSELAALEVSDLAFSAEGLAVTLRRSKTDQEGRGRKVAVAFGGNAATCPVRAVRDWLTAAFVSAGPVFRSVNRHGAVGDALCGRDVARIVQRAAERAGLDASRFAGHSLRAGFVTAAVRAGKSNNRIMDVTGHTSERTLRRYIREAEMFRDCANEGIGL